MNRRRMIAASACLLGFAFSLAAADKPDFTGEWKMNAEKSDFGARPAPESIVRKVDHKEPNLTVTTTQKGERGEFTTEAKYATDGQEYRNKTRMGESKSVLNWDGNALVNSTKMSFQGNEITSVDRWTLSEDGKVLTSNAKLSSQMGEAELKIVFEKQ